MGRQPRTIQSDGLPRATNPVTRDLLRAAFGDGKWRTLHDMMIKLTDHIPIELAARAAREPKKPISLETRIRAGRRRLVQDPLVAAVLSGIFESRKGTHGIEYRCVKPVAYRAKVGNKLAPPDLTRPATGTKCGISYAAVYQLIEENRDINVVSLTDKLAACMRDDEITTRYINTLVRRALKGPGRKKTGPARDRVTIRAEIMARYADPIALRDEARQYVVRTIITGLIHKKKVEEIRLFRVVEQ